MRKMVIEVFPRARYAATTSGRTYTPRERAKLAKLMGEANEIWFHTRVYSPSSLGDCLALCDEDDRLPEDEDPVERSLQTTAQPTSKQSIYLNRSSL